jgi:hypothetical protein
VAGMGWKALRKTVDFHEKTDFNFCVMCLTAQGRIGSYDNLCMSYSYLSDLAGLVCAITSVL